MNKRRKGTPASKSNGSEVGVRAAISSEEMQSGTPLSPFRSHNSCLLWKPTAVANGALALDGSPTISILHHSRLQYVFLSLRTQWSPQTEPYPSPAMRMARLDRISDLWRRVLIRGTQPRYVTTTNCHSQLLANIKTCDLDPTASAVNPNSGAGQLSLPTVQQMHQPLPNRHQVPCPCIH